MKNIFVITAIALSMFGNAMAQTDKAPATSATSAVTVARIEHAAKQTEAYCRLATVKKVEANPIICNNNIMIAILAELIADEAKNLKPFPASPKN